MTQTKARNKDSERKNETARRITCWGDSEIASENAVDHAGM